MRKVLLFSWKKILKIWHSKSEYRFKSNIDEEFFPLMKQFSPINNRTLGKELHVRAFPRIEYYFHKMPIERERNELARWPSLFSEVEWTALNAMTSLPTSFPVPSAADYPNSVPLTRNFSWIEGRPFIPSRLWMNSLNTHCSALEKNLTSHENYVASFLNQNISYSSFLDF